MTNPRGAVRRPGALAVGTHRRHWSL